MKVKNISGQKTYFRFGRTGVMLENNETANVCGTDVGLSAGGTIGTSPTESFEGLAFSDALTYEEKGLIEILEGSSQTKNIALNAFPAYGYLALSGQPSDGDAVEFTYDGSTETFTFKTSASGTYEVEIQGSPQASLEELKTKVNDLSAIVEFAEVTTDPAVSIFAKKVGPSTNTIGFTTNGSALTKSDSFGGGQHGSVVSNYIVSYTVTNVDITAGFFMLPVPSKSEFPVFHVAKHVDTNGATQFLDTATVKNAVKVLTTGGSEANTITAGDTVTLLVYA